MHGLVENVGNILQNTIQFFLTIAITKKKKSPFLVSNHRNSTNKKALNAPAK